MGMAVFDRLLASPTSAFALLHRPSWTGGDRIEVLVGELRLVRRLADLPLRTEPRRPGHELLAVVPYRQITERGFACRDDAEPIRAMTVTGQQTIDLAEAARLLPRAPVELLDARFDIDDSAYADLVRTVVRDEIGRGAGSNFVIRRSFTATVPGRPPQVALALFANLLAAEAGAYWTFVMHAGDRTFVGASPERHVSLAGGTAVMNPISGTYRYPPSGPALPGVLDFLRDRKEIDELHMVLDEELKIMAAVCDQGGRVDGPYLREMARLAHTEYLIEGRSGLSVPDLLRGTMFAPTVTGSPLENACRVVARYEPVGRGSYGGALALVGRDAAGRRTLDSAILIRTAEIDRSGLLRLGVGATLVRHSDPRSEVAETAAKAAGLLTAAGHRSRGGSTPVAPPGRIGSHPAVRAALAHRKDSLAPFWLAPPDTRARTEPGLVGRRILVVDAEDRFTAMLGLQLRALGLAVTIATHREIGPDLGRAAGLHPDHFDAVLLGPGPGDPLDPADPKIVTLRALAARLLQRRQPLLAVCLGHQVLAATLGFAVVRKDAPSQGQQREIDLFGRRERVGFYNTFAAYSAANEVASPATGGPVQVSRDPVTGEVHGLRGYRFASVQFHLESVLTRRGPELLAGMVRWVLCGQPALATADTPA